MTLGSHAILIAVCMGIGANLLMDGWNLFLFRVFRVPSLNYCLLGRWILHMPGGTFRHTSIGAAPKKRLECPVGWLAHYTIGVLLAVGFVVLQPPTWLARPTLLAAVLYGVCTVAFPFFIMQPALGLGIASSKTVAPARARVKSLATHTVFGIGLYLSALLVCALTRAT